MQVLFDDVKMGQILGQNGFWGTIWGIQMSVFGRICTKEESAMSI